MQIGWSNDEVALLIPQPDVMDLSNDTQPRTVTSGAIENSTLKRPRADVAKSERNSKAKALPAVDASECQICLENYTNGGEKRCVVTKCGHIFCYLCICTVIENRQPCPKCRKKLGKISHLYTIYDTTITAVDASQVDEARRLEADERAKRIEVLSRFTLDNSRSLLLSIRITYDFMRHST